MRNMSFMLTTQQMYDRTKRITRRLGWWFLGADDIVMSCEQCRGLKKGQKIIRMYPIYIIDTRQEPLDWITEEDVIAEGFPDKDPDWFIDMFRIHNKCAPDTLVNRIEFKEYKGDI